ncbi:DivIVA domain-containing protein [Kribbella sp. NPDC049227]|uniref:DivIVA domain-containing protein n=1 Tax=Kribbella sp. NPDC049227 TaxID=3364113 RepID=UPI00371C4B61
MWFFGLIVVLLIGAVAVVASGRWGAMSTAYDDRPDMTVPARQALSSADIESARFAVGLRGYRMDEVDTLLERVAKEVAERDRRIADLERAVAPIVEAPDGAGFTSRSRYSATDFDDTGAQKPIMVGGDFPESDTSEQPSVTAEQPVVTSEQAEQPSVSPEQAAAGGQPGQTGSTSQTPGDAQTPGGAQIAGGAQSAGGAQIAGGAQTAGGVQPSAGVQPAAAQGVSPAAYLPPLTLQQPVAADEPVTAEQPVTTEQTAGERSAASHAAAADEYERLQAEARALLEAQSQPGPPRRTPAERQPAPQQSTPPRQSETRAPEPQQPESASYEPEGEAWYQRPAPEQPPAADSSQGQQRSVPAAGPQPAPTPHWVLPDPAPQHEEPAPPDQGAYQRPS